jgi:NADH:quinone reductase (non-electrogenic)
MSDKELFSKSIRPRVVIVGAGFGGIALAKKLRNSSFDVVLIDKNNYHTFIPLLYQVATGGLEPGSIAYPVRRIIRDAPNVIFRMAEVLHVNCDTNILETSIGDIPYNHLVIATGSTNNFFGFEPMKNELLTLKSVPEALDMRSFIMQNLEKALYTSDDQEHEELINIVIIGGGPAGIELAGALAEMRKYVLPKDFPELDISQMDIYIFEAHDRVLSFMSKEASANTQKYLEKLGVIVRTNTMVTNYEDSKIYLEDNTEINVNTVIWTAGVKGYPIPGLPPSAIVGQGRIAVDQYNQVLDCPNVFAIGDVAFQTTSTYPGGLPMLAPVAVGQGKLLAKNLMSISKGNDLKEFKYRSKGIMATIGRNRAVADFPRFKLNGAFAWFAWMLVHILSLVGFRNKVVAVVGWIGNYYNYDRPLGLIIRPFSKKSNTIKIDD